MIRFENGMLVLNNTATKEDVDAINEYAEYIRNQEQERICDLIEELRQFMVKARQSGDVDILLAEEHYKRLTALIKGENK